MNSKLTQKHMEDWYELTVLLMKNADSEYLIDMKDIIKGQWRDSWARGRYERDGYPTGGIAS